MEVIRSLPKLTSFTVDLNYGGYGKPGDTGRMAFMFDHRGHSYSLPKKIASLEGRVKRVRFEVAIPALELEERQEVLSSMSNQQLTGVFEQIGLSLDTLPDTSSQALRLELANLRAYLEEMDANKIDASSMRRAANG